MLRRGISDIKSKMVTIQVLN